MFSLAIRRTHSASSMPRIRPLLNLILIISIIVIALLGVSKWPFIKMFMTGVREGGKGGGPVDLHSFHSIPKANPKPARLFQQSFRPLFKQLRLVAFGEEGNMKRRAAESKMLCKNKIITFRLILVLPDNVKVTRVEEIHDNLQLIDYGACKVHLVFVVPSTAEVGCAAFVDQIKWKFGKVYSYSASDTAVRDTVATSWEPINDTEFAIILDDQYLSNLPSTGLNKNIFSTALATVAAYFIDAEGKRDPSVIAQKVSGVCLMGSEGDEDKEHSSDSMSLKQASCGAAAYVPWHWNLFAEFTKFRKSSISSGSWRQNYEEFLRFYGYLMLRVNGAAMGSKSVRWFTSLKELPVYDFNKGLHDHVGQLAIEEVNEDYYNILPSNPSFISPIMSGSRCLLDEFTDPLPPPSKLITRKKKQMYLCYEPHGSWMDQLDTLQRAHVLAAELGRTLIVPPFVNPDNSSESVEISTLWSYENYTIGRVTPHHSFPFSHFTIPRHVLFRTRPVRYDLMLKLANPIQERHKLNVGVEVMLPTLWSSDFEMKGYVGGCDRDQLLYIRNFNHATDQFLDPRSSANYKDLLSSWSLSQPLKDFLNETNYIWPSPLVCTVYSRGNGKIPCGMDIFNSTEEALKYFRSCHAGPSRLIDYAVETALKFNITTKSVFLLSEAPYKEKLLPTDKNIMALTVDDLTREIQKRPELGIPEGMASHIADMLQRELCRQAPLFINNVYSPLGTIITKLRESSNGTTTFLGETYSS